MTILVLDCSIAMAWLFQDEVTQYSESALEALEGGSVGMVPTLWPFEVSNVLLVGERRGRVTAAQTTGFLDILEDLDIRVDEVTTTQAWKDTLHLARQYNLTAYDAAYLELALRAGGCLATLDRRLRSAGERSGVALW